MRPRKRERQLPDEPKPRLAEPAVQSEHEIFLQAFESKFSNFVSMHHVAK